MLFKPKIDQPQECLQAPDATASDATSMTTSSFDSISLMASSCFHVNLTKTPRRRRRKTQAQRKALFKSTEIDKPQEMLTPLKAQEFQAHVVQFRVTLTKTPRRRRKTQAQRKALFKSTKITKTPCPLPGRKKSPSVRLPLPGSKPPAPKKQPLRKMDEDQALLTPLKAQDFEAHAFLYYRAQNETKEKPLGGTWKPRNIFIRPAKKANRRWARSYSSHLGPRKRKVQMAPTILRRKFECSRELECKPVKQWMAYVFAPDRRDQAHQEVYDAQEAADGDLLKAFQSTPMEVLSDIQEVVAAYSNKSGKVPPWLQQAPFYQEFCKSQPTASVLPTVPVLPNVAAVLPNDGSNSNDGKPMATTHSDSGGDKTEPAAAVLPNVAVLPEVAVLPNDGSNSNDGRPTATTHSDSDVTLAVLPSHPTVLPNHGSTSKSNDERPTATRSHSDVDLGVLPSNNSTVLPNDERPAATHSVLPKDGSNSKSNHERPTATRSHSDVDMGVLPSNSTVLPNGERPTATHSVLPSHSTVLPNDNNGNTNSHNPSTDSDSDFAVLPNQDTDVNSNVNSNFAVVPTDDNGNSNPRPATDSDSDLAVLPIGNGNSNSNPRPATDSDSDLAAVLPIGNGNSNGNSTTRPAADSDSDLAAVLPIGNGNSNGNSNNNPNPDDDTTMATRDSIHVHDNQALETGTDESEGLEGAEDAGDLEGVVEAATLFDDDDHSQGGDINGNAEDYAGDELDNVVEAATLNGAQEVPVRRSARLRARRVQEAVEGVDPQQPVRRSSRLRRKPDWYVPTW